MQRLPQALPPPIVQGQIQAAARRWAEGLQQRLQRLQRLRVQSGKHRCQGLQLGGDGIGVISAMAGVKTTGFAAAVQQLMRDYPFLESRHAERLFRLYGRTAYALLGEATSYGDLGECLGHDLYAAEIDHLVEREWAMTAEDVLWRRTKLGLRLDDPQKARVAAWLRERVIVHALEGA